MVAAYTWPLMLWQLVFMAQVLPTYVVPAPTEVVASLWRDWEFISGNLTITLQEVLLGFALALVGALAWSAILLASPVLRRFAYPLMVAANVAPKELLGPVAILWFGFSMLPKVLLAAVIAFFPILVGTMVGLEQFDNRLKLVAQSMGASKWRTFFSFRMWDALPSFLSAVRLGLTLAIVGAVLGEFLGADRGLGYAIVSAGRRLDSAALFANLAVMVSVSLVLIGLVNWCERSLIRTPTTNFPR
jgi:NitT/TauT family transport system permease protein